MTIIELKAALQACRDQRRRGPYPRELRESIVAYAKKRLAQHASVTVIAGEVGIKQETLSLWLKSKRPLKARGSLVPVAIVQPAIVQSRRDDKLVIELGPMRVHGLDVEKLAILVRRLM